MDDVCNLYATSVRITPLTPSLPPFRPPDRSVLPKQYHSHLNNLCARLDYNGFFSKTSRRTPP